MQADVYRRMSPEERHRLAGEMTAQADRIAADGIRARHPDYADRDVEWALRRLRLADDELFTGAWPDAPLLDP